MKINKQTTASINFFSKVIENKLLKELEDETIEAFDLENDIRRVEEMATDFIYRAWEYGDITLETNDQFYMVFTEKECKKIFKKVPKIAQFKVLSLTLENDSFSPSSFTLDYELEIIALSNIE